MEMQVWGTCLGHQLLQILTANTSYNELLVQTDSVVSSAACLHPCPAALGQGVVVPL